MIPQARDSVRALVGAAALGSSVGLAIGGAYLAGGLARLTVVHAEIQTLAGRASAGFTDDALRASASGEDTAVLAIAKAHDPSPVLGESEQDRQVASLVDRLEARRALRASPDARPALLAAAEPEAGSATVPAPSKPLVVKVAAARPFHLREALDESRALECLTQAVYYEARGEPLSGQRAVAQVILNRVRSPLFPKTVCGVVFQGVRDGGCQFSFACQGLVGRRPSDSAAWRRSEQVAAEALNGQVESEIGDATHFHAAGRASSWAAGLLKVAQIGAHVFYRLAGHGAHTAPAPEEGPQRPVFASLSLAPPAAAGSPSPGAGLIATASAAVGRAATAVEAAAKAAVAPDGRARDDKPSEEPAAKPAAPAAKTIAPATDAAAPAAAPLPASAAPAT